MTTFLFLRHAHSEANAAGILAGRTAGIHLSEKGLEQSIQIASVLEKFPIQRIYSSPLERCLETIEPLRKRNRVRIQVAKEVVEMDYGNWSGEKLRTLSRKPLWRKIQRKPESVIFPAGESFTHAWKRVERFLTELSQKHPRSTILICTHGDIIKMAITMTIGAPLNSFQNIVVDPASLSVAQWSRNQRTLVSANRSLSVDRKKKARGSSNLKGRRILGGGNGG